MWYLCEQKFGHCPILVLARVWIDGLFSTIFISAFILTHFRWLVWGFSFNKTWLIFKTCYLYTHSHTPFLSFVRVSRLVVQSHYLLPVVISSKGHYLQIFTNLKECPSYWGVVKRKWHRGEGLLEDVVNTWLVLRQAGPLRNNSHGIKSQTSHSYRRQG